MYCFSLKCALSLFQGKIKPGTYSKKPNWGRRLGQIFRVVERVAPEINLMRSHSFKFASTWFGGACRMGLAPFWHVALCRPVDLGLPQFSASGKT